MSAHDEQPPTASSVPKSWERAVATLLADPNMASLAHDCYFDGTAIEAGARYWASTEWQTVRTLLPRRAGRALDVGAGRGIASYALARDGWSVSALEPDGSALVGAGAIRTMATQAGYSIDVHQAFGEKLPFDDQQFDLVFARQSLHHAHDLPALIRELHRVLRPSALLVAIRDHVITKRADLNRFFEIHPLQRLYGGENAYLLQEYLVSVEDAGFSLLKSIAPFESPINYAPLEPSMLPVAIADQLPNFCGVRRFAAGVLSIPAILTLACKALRWIDNRPGRLYSFVAVKKDP